MVLGSARVEDTLRNTWTPDFSVGTALLYLLPEHADVL